MKGTGNRKRKDYTHAGSARAHMPPGAVLVSAAVPVELRQRVEAEAERLDVPLSAVVRRALTEHLDQ